MKNFLLIMVLALGMCSINVCAQEKEYKVEDDGFEWYRVSKKESGKISYGAQDKSGNTIVPTKYDSSIGYDNGILRVFDDEMKVGAFDTKGNLIIPVEYYCVTAYPVNGLSKENSLIWVATNNFEYSGYYNMFGKCIIPTSRNYKDVTPLDDRFYCYLSKYGTFGQIIICDASGKVVYKSKKDCTHISLINDVVRGKYTIIKDYKYFVDSNDDILWNPQCDTILFNKNDVSSIKIKKGGVTRKLTQLEMNKVLQNGDLLIGNKDYFANNKRLLESRTNYEASSNTSSSINNGSNNSNSGNTTSTVVIEHRRDPIPVQQWQACFACGGMGTMGCDFCGGSGTKYIGDNLRRCSRCNGGGIIPCNVCFGNKGKYITVYQ